MVLSELSTFTKVINYLNEVDETKFDKDKLNNLIGLGLIEISSDRLKVLPKGRILLNQIIKELLI